jgi:transposase
MAFKLRAYLNGDESVFRIVSVPAPETEDAKRISRERTQLVSERTRHINRIRALLALYGIRLTSSVTYKFSNHPPIESRIVRASGSGVTRT